MSRNDFIAIILGVSVVLGLIVTNLIFKAPSDIDKFRYPTSISRIEEQPETLTHQKAQPRATRETGKDSRTGITYGEEGQGSEPLSEEELYALSTRGGLTPETGTAASTATPSIQTPQTETGKNLSGSANLPGTTAQNVSPEQPESSSQPSSSDEKDRESAASTTESLTESVPAPPQTEAPETEYPESYEASPTQPEQEYFQPGDVATIAGLGAIDASEEQASNESATSPTPTMFLPDQAVSSEGYCASIINASSEQFPLMNARSTAYYASNPELNRFEMSIPYGSLSGYLSRNGPLVIDVAVFREGETKSNATVFRFIWNNLSGEIHPDSTINFAVIEKRAFRNTRTRFQIWINAGQICGQQVGFKRFSMNILSGQGKIFDIPLSAPTQTSPSLTTGQ